MFNKVFGEHRNRRQQVNTDTVQQIEELNGKIRELVEQESPRFVCGKLLYDEIRKDGTLQLVKRRLQMLHRLLKAIDFAAFSRLQKKISPRPPTTLSSSSSTKRGMDDKDMYRLFGEGKRGETAMVSSL